MMTDQSFAGRVALVTGAAGELGESTALQLGAAGASLALLDLRPDGLDRLRDRLNSMAVRSVAVTADQSDREKVEHAIAGIVGELGAIDAVFANAGYGQFSTFLETSAKNWSRHVNVNLTWSPRRIGRGCWLSAAITSLPLASATAHPDFGNGSAFRRGALATSSRPNAYSTS
jgi:NAD(P)-dependent dehydrogenase (short-subunit alcohol dehydrogenase family)